MRVTFDAETRSRFKSGEFPGLFGIHIETASDKITAGGPVTDEELKQINKFFCDFQEERARRLQAERTT